jgi:predicted dehydrogenase
VTFAPQSLPRVQASAPRTVALIGAGRMGSSHALALRELGVGLTALCDTRAEARSAVGDQFGVARGSCFARADELFARERDLDLVVVATTADTHGELVRAAAAAGARNVLCEKPLAASVAECDAMIAACAAAGTKLAVNHQMRFMDQYRLVKEELESGVLGRLASMTVVGGCLGLAMNGSHYIEAFAHLTGALPVEASAWFSGAPVPNPRGPAFFDQAGEMRIRADSGQRLNLVIGADQGHGMTVTYAGAFGHIFVDELAGEMIVTARRSEHRGAPATRYGMPWERRTRRFHQADNVGPTRAMAAALLAGDGYTTGQEGRHIVATLAACYASDENGHRPFNIEALGKDSGRVFPWA